MLEFMLNEVIYIARDVDENSLVIEDCGQTDEALEGYKVLAKGDRVPEVVDLVTDVDERKKKHLRNLLKTPRGIETIVRFIIKDTGETYTGKLLDKYGTVDALLEHYGLAEPIQKAIVEDEEPDDIIPEDIIDEELPDDIMEEMEAFDIDAIEEDEEIEDIEVPPVSLEEVDPIEEIKVEEPDIEVINMAEDEIPPVVLEEDEPEPISEEIVEETEPEIEPKEDIEKHEIGEENSYNKEKIKEQVEQALDEVMSEKLSEMIEKKFGDVGTMSKNMDKMVQLMTLMVEQGGSPKEEIAEIVEPVDESETFHKEEVEEILEHFQTEIKGIDSNLLKPFISMYEEGNEEFVTELLLKTLEDLDKIEKEGVL